MKIVIKHKHKSLPKGLDMGELPNFSIITGENGAGKTHLLEYIKNFGVEGIDINFINYIPSDWKTSSREKKSRQQYEAEIMQASSTLINYFRRASC